MTFPSDANLGWWIIQHISNQEECANFIRLIEPWNRTQLYVCGTGAYNPVCTFVNRGRRPQVRIKGLRIIQVAHQIIGQLCSQASQMAYSGWLSPFPSAVVLPPQAAFPLLWFSSSGLFVAPFCSFSWQSCEHSCPPEGAVSATLFSLGLSGDLLNFLNQSRASPPFLTPLQHITLFERYAWSPMMTQGLFSKGKWQVHFPSVSLTQNSLEHL